MILAHSYEFTERLQRLTAQPQPEAASVGGLFHFSRLAHGVVLALAQATAPPLGCLLPLSTQS